MEAEIKFDSRENKSPRNPYAKRYMINRINVVINDEVTKRMREIKNKRKFKSDSDTIKYLCDLETAIDPVFNTEFKCKICNENIKNVPQNINVNRFLHNDLCRTNPCKGHIVESKEIALDDKGFVISNKGTTTTKDDSNGTNDEKEREMDIQLGYRNGVRITDMDDPNYDNKFFDIDLPNHKKKLEEERLSALK